jgi:hypothetical protein
MVAPPLNESHHKLIHAPAHATAHNPADWTVAARRILATQLRASSIYVDSLQNPRHCVGRATAQLDQVARRTVAAPTAKTAPRASARRRQAISKLGLTFSKGRRRGRAAAFTHETPICFSQGPPQIGRQIDRRWRGLLIHAKFLNIVRNDWHTGTSQTTHQQRGRRTGKREG